MVEPVFRDRREAGRVLARRLQSYARAPELLVLGLPRGGVPVAYEVAQALHAPLDVFLVRKLGVPGTEELAMGALASGGVRVLNQPVIEHLNLPWRAVEQVTAREQAELRRRERAYRNQRPPLDVNHKTVILVDDGLATGASMRAAVEALGRMGPARLVVAVPVAAAETCAALRALADEVVCAFTPEDFEGVGKWYEDFSATTDDEVRALLNSAEHTQA
jgi:putative phosphoribosyl transferase